MEEPWAVANNVSISQSHNNVAVGVGDDNWLYMSAVCWIYGKQISSATGKPVGLVNTNWGGR